MATSTSNSNDLDLALKLSESISKIKSELAKKIVGQHEVIDDLLACFLAGGHCLLIGVPGLAKTMLVQSLARASTWRSTASSSRPT